MSATGRGTTRDEKDFYPTPRASFEPLLRVLPTLSTYWEPCAGDGRIVRWLRESGRKADGADLFPQKDFPCEPTDYLRDDTMRDFVITNPPFGVAFAICQHALPRSNDFMPLLRLSFLESEERSEWLSANEPDALFVLKKRPSYVMSITCKTPIKMGVEGSEFDPLRDGPICKHNWLLPIESERPKLCVKCGGDKLSISTSDNSGYAWFYWGDFFKGIHHI